MDAKYRANLSEHGWTEEQIKQYDALALENHSYEATPAQRRRWEKNWHIVFNKEGQQGPIRQRPDFRTKNMLKVLAKELIQSIQHTKQDKNMDNNLKDPRCTPSRFTLELDGNIILASSRTIGSWDRKVI